MPAFVSPVVDPATWTFARTTTPATLPPGLRYAGYALPGVSASRAGTATGSVRMPATGFLRAVTAGRVFVEVQVNPFPIRRVASAIPGGLPTFYLSFAAADATWLDSIEGKTAIGAEALRDTSEVSIFAIGQDRQALDPLLWASRIGAAIGTGGGDASQWTPFVTALTAAIGGGATAPVHVYDHAGQLRTGGAVEIVLGPPATETVHPVTITLGDAGDLQRTVQRYNSATPATMPIANLWGGGATSFRLRVPGGLESGQLVRLGDGVTASREIEITPAQSSVALTDLDTWFSPQSSAGSSLPRYTRGNQLTTFVNGPAYFDDLFTALRDAQAPGSGLHLTGWSMCPQTKFVKRTFGDDPLVTTSLAKATAMLGTDMIPLTLEQAAKLIGDAGGKTRFLPSKLFQLAPGQTLQTVEAIGVHLVIDVIAILNILPIDRLQRAVQTDTAGFVLLALIWIGATVYTAYIIASDGKPIEQNREAVKLLDTTNGLANAISRFAPYPARVDDNFPAPNLAAFPFNTLFPVVRNFGVYHQKLAIVKTPAATIGYCGGIDLNVDRVDDVHHLQPGPFHDVHARIEGNAVRDLAISFEQRWQHDAGDTNFAFQAPPFSPALAPGTDIVQIARTYFAPAASGSARGFTFAPDGERTILDTMLAAITGATELIYIEDQYLTPPLEYRTALVGKVDRGEIKQLIITVPALADQPFGEGARDVFVNDLIVADRNRGIVRVGYPRRRFTSTDNSRRASAGKLLLESDLPASAGVNPTIFLGPKSRLPALPFWVSVEGELIYVYDESLVPNARPEAVQAFTCERGSTTNFVRGGSAPAGTTTREHKRGAPATVIDCTSIYVHAKLIIVDDVFLGLGSANLNRRGLSYDAEINAFTIPAALRNSPRNPALMLRRQLWAEMLDLPEGMMAPLLTDPLGSGRLFDRSPFAGNRYVPLDARPLHLMRGLATGDGAISLALQTVMFSIVVDQRDTLFLNVVDPASRTEAAP